MSQTGTTSVRALINRGVLQVGDGYRTKRAEHGQPGFRILRVADILDDVVKLDGADFVSEKHRTQIGSKLAQSGDIVLTTKGTVGRVALMPKANETVVYSPQLCYFRVLDESVLNARYLRYWFRSAAFKAQASHRMNNTDMAAYINLADLRSLEIDLPPLDAQLTIAEVLDALDDKIAANVKMARTVNDLVNTQFLAVVRGVSFSEKTFADLASVRGGGTPRTGVAEFWGGAINWATPTDVTSLPGPYLETTARRITTSGLDTCASALYPSGSILMTSRATIGAFAVAQTPIAVNQGFIVVNPHDPHLLWWMFHEMRSRVDEFISLANGATFLELSRGNFRNFRVRIADNSTMAEFAARADALHACARGALVENGMLVATRDVLLPLLMSGELRVKDAEKTVEEVL